MLNILQLYLSCYHKRHGGAGGGGGGVASKNVNSVSVTTVHCILYISAPNPSNFVYCKGDKKK